jgi:hypothetical protein
MIFRQYIDDEPFCASYLLGDAGEAVVVDPVSRFDGGGIGALAEHGIRLARA